MAKKYILCLLLVLSLALSLASCNECKAHVDADDDYLCDSCGEKYDDGDEAPEIELNSVTVTVKLDNGQPISGVKFTLTRGETDLSATSGADGTARFELEAGIYQVSYDHDTLPEYCFPDTTGFKVEEGTTDITLTVMDNKPDGSAEKPFFLSERQNEITLAPGQEIHYSIRVATIRYINVYNSAAVISYNGESYEAVDGVAALVIQPEDSDVRNTVFSVKNSSDSEIVTTLEITAPLGSMENPIELTDGGATVTVNCDTTVYYSFTATAGETLTLTSNTDRNNIYVRRVLEDDVPVDTYTDGAISVSTQVAAGDVITIGVSALVPTDKHENKDYDVEITFNISIE